MLSCSWSLYRAVGVGRDNDILILCMSRPAANNNAGPEGTITGGWGPGAPPEQGAGLTKSAGPPLLGRENGRVTGHAGEGGGERGRQSRPAWGPGR